MPQFMEKYNLRHSQTFETVQETKEGSEIPVRRAATFSTSDVRRWCFP
jgi:hypothetical protein